MPRTLPNSDVLVNGIGHDPSAIELSEDRLRHQTGARVWDADGQSVDLGGQGADEPDLLASLGLIREGETDPEINPDMERLSRENTELREIIAELKQQIETAQPAIAQAEQAVLERKDYEALLEEKSALIRSLHLKVQELREPRPVAAGGSREDELLALSEELDRERCQLQQQRRGLEEERKLLMDDEQSMTKQMRDMEVQMARERADFARQRSELTRIYEEVRREMENIERNGLLNQRLGQLRQRIHEAGMSAGSSPSLRSGAIATVPAPRSEPKPPEVPSPPETKRRESFIGRLFG